MALDHPVVRLSGGRWLDRSRLAEVGVVVALAVAVVVVAAIWGSSSESVEQVSVTALDAGSGLAASQPAESTMSSNVDVEPAASADVTSPRSSGVSAGASVERDPMKLAIQVGVVREIPEFGGGLLPRSFEQYQVQRGETLDSIAAAQGLTMSDLLLWNLHLDEGSVLIPGEWISIPQWSGTTVAEEPNGALEEEKSGRGGG